MEDLGLSLSLLALFSPVAVIAAAVVVYLKFRVSLSGARRSPVLFALGALAVGVVAGWAGIGVGVGIYCSSSQSNLCGLGGYFVVGPLFFSLAVSAYLFLWAKLRKAP